jgi:hypothetical protein
MTSMHHICNFATYALLEPAGDTLRSCAITAAIDPTAESDPRDWATSDVQHALLKRIYELESDVCILRSRLRGGRAARRRG